jgi:hypothetical protein
MRAVERAGPAAGSAEIEIEARRRGLTSVPDDEATGTVAAGDRLGLSIAGQPWRRAAGAVVRVRAQANGADANGAECPLPLRSDDARPRSPAPPDQPMKGIAGQKYRKEEKQRRYTEIYGNVRRFTYIVVHRRKLS